MKRILTFLLPYLLSPLFPFLTQAQIQHPVKWDFSVEQKSNAEATLVLKATVNKGWHIYSQHIDGVGPIPTAFTFESGNKYELSGKAEEEGKGIEEMDKSFDIKVKYYYNAVTFRQKVKVKSDKPFTIKGSVEWMVCDDHQCLPPDTKEFELKINEGVKKSETGNQKPEKETKASIEQHDTVVSAVPVASQPLVPSDSGNSAQIIPAQNGDLEPGCGDDEGNAAAGMSLWTIFFGGLVGGLLALLTPCVFPMIPLTVSFFTKYHNKEKKSKGIVDSLIYAACIVLIYVGLGFLITVTLGSDALNAMASSGFFNLLFFIIFIVFAISFFGVFEIVLPSSLVNFSSAASEKRGLVGIFFMAFTLSLVSFSCTGPIIGTLLVEAAHGQNYLGPLAGMAGFSVALALPFALFAMFPGWLHSLPKSGGWLNTVKVTLGFLELALALKFLSNVDLAYHWGFLKRELFIALWVIIFGMLGFYLLGKIKFSHDSEVKHLSIGRLLFSIFSFTFTLYLVPGIWGAPLKLISGFPPPEFYKEWIGAKATACPHDLNCFHDFDEGMAYAKAQKKPVMLDFTGWSCVNCRKMEDNVWSAPPALKRLAENYVLISLYVDDKEALAENKQYTSAFSGKKIKTTGNRWSDLQASQYNTNSQPYYVLLDNKGRQLARPRGYNPDVSAFVKFLDEGLCRFSKRGS